MSVEEASSTQNTVPMETVEAPVNNAVPTVNGEVEISNPDVSLRAKQLIDGVHGDNIEEVLNSTLAIAESVQANVHLPTHVIQAVHFMTDFVVQKNCAIRGIPIVESVLSKCHVPGVLTSLHSDIVQLCLAAKLLSPALKYLDCDVTSISSDEEMDVRYVLQYYYYGGSLYAALRNFSRALHFLEICLSVPSQQTTSAIQVVAYQKVILAGILSGQRVNVRLSSLHSSIPHLCRPYTNLLQIAAEGDADKFAATIAQMTPFLEKHNNLGLAKQALEHIRQQNVKKFQSTFVSLKLSSLANHLKLPVQEVENRLRRMIMSGDISAQICKREEIVWFNKQTDEFDNSTAIEKLKQSLDTCMVSYQKAKELNTTLSLDTKLLSRISESESRKDAMPTSSNWDFPAHGKSKLVLSFLE